MESTHRSQSGDIVIGKQCCKRNFAFQQPFAEGIAEQRSRVVDIHLDGKLRLDLDLQIFRHLTNRLPAVFSIRTEWLSLQERNVSVPQLLQVSKRHASGVMMIEHNVSHSRQNLVSGNSDGGQ